MNARDIQNLRLKMGHTQTSFAKGLGISSSTVSRWECGVTKPTGTGQLLLKKLQQEIDQEATDA